MPFGKYCRNSPFVFSFDPRYHGLCGSQKYTAMPVAMVKRLRDANSSPRSHVNNFRSASGSVRIFALSLRTIRDRHNSDSKLEPKGEKSWGWRGRAFARVPFARVPGLEWLASDGT